MMQNKRIICTHCITTFTLQHNHQHATQLPRVMLDSDMYTLALHLMSLKSAKITGLLLLRVVYKVTSGNTWAPSTVPHCPDTTDGKAIRSVLAFTTSASKGLLLHSQT